MRHVVDGRWGGARLEENLELEAKERGAEVHHINQLHLDVGHGAPLEGRLERERCHLVAGAHVCIQQQDTAAAWRGAVAGRGIERGKAPAYKAQKDGDGREQVMHDEGEQRRDHVLGREAQRRWRLHGAAPEVGPRVERSVVFEEV